MIIPCYESLRTLHLDVVQGGKEERVNRTNGTENEPRMLADTAIRQESARAAGFAGRQGSVAEGVECKL